MEIKPDHRKLTAILVVGFMLCALSILIYLNLEGTGKLIWTAFLLASGLIYLMIGLLTKSKFILTEEYFELSSISGLMRQIIPLKDIKKVKFRDEELSAVAHVNNFFMPLLWDKKFRTIKQLELLNDKGRIAKVDGHLIDDNDFEMLKKKLK